MKRTCKLLPMISFAILAACAKPYPVPDTTPGPWRTSVFAVAPITNEAPDPEGATAGRAIREAIYAELNRHQEEYSVALQDLAETDQRLQAAGLSDSAAAALPVPELCRILGADAVMLGTVYRYQKKGAAGQVATTLLFGWAKGSEVRADVRIYGAADGQRIWQHDIYVVGGFLSSPDGLRKRVGATVARKFPFRK